MNENETEEIILFNNGPLYDPKEDAFDFNIKSNAIKTAINNRARIIALIGEYGSGKSTLTNILYDQNKDSFEKPIYVNLWDCICKKEKEINSNNTDDNDKKDEEKNNKNRINSFTKSFLYQFASGNKKRSSFTRYINQRLSKNYGKISIAVSKKRSIIFLSLVIIVFLFYFGLKSSRCWIEIFGCQVFNELWLVLALPFLFFAFKNDNFLFSLWDSQGKIEPSDTDCFEIFKEIIDHIRIKKNKKQLVIIEDLDRTDDAEIVVSLLKELYRFINLLSDEDKNKFVFIVSLKSEQSLISQSDINQSNEDYQKQGLHIYSKIFDYTVWIRPLYFENVRDIVDKLLASKFGEEKKNEILPQLYWIIQGNNLTVREIKDRLNEVFLLHSSLSRRDKLDSDVKYNKCSAVVYLQREYPKEFQELISHEKEFAEIVKNYYYNGKLSEKKDFAFINDIYFIEKFVEMQKKKDIENDYAMYFFNYPKNAEIMTLEERYIYDAIIHNSYNPSEKENINKMLDNIINNNKQKVIKKALSELMEYKITYGEFVFEFERIFEIALSLKNDYTLLSLSQFVKDNIHIEKSIFYIAEISKYKYVENDTILKEAIISIPVSAVYEEYFKSKNVKFIEGWRVSIIQFFPDNISSFSNLFINDNLPIVDISTLFLLKNAKDIFYCLNFSLITQNNFKSYLEYLCKIDFSNKDYELLEKGLLSISNLSSIPDSYVLLQKLLMKNKIYEESLFEIIFTGYKQIKNAKVVIDYIQCIDYSLLSLSMLEKLDELITKEITDLTLIKLLESNGLYNSSIYSRLSINNFTDFNFKNGWLKENIDRLGQIINKDSKDLLMLLRIEFIKNNAASEIYVLFNSNYDFVTEQELKQLNTPDDLYYITDFSRVTQENCIYFSNYCNSSLLESDELFNFFKSLFFKLENDTTNQIISNEITLIILKNIDYTKCKFSSMKTEQQNKIVEVFTPIIQLNEANNALEFMKIVHCHVEKLDKLIQDTIASENDDLFVGYLEWCNIVPVTSEEFINFLSTKKINIPLVQEITKELYKKGLYTQYIVGKSLNDNEVFYNDKISIYKYYEAYSQSDKYFELVKDSSIVKKIHEAGIYDSSLTIEKLEPFKTITRQSCHLIKLFFSKLQTKEEKKQYFTEIPDIKSYKECESLIEFLTQDSQLELFHNDYSFRDVVKEKLWETDDEGKNKKKVLKTRFTKTLNNALIKKYGNCN